MKRDRHEVMLTRLDRLVDDGHIDAGNPDLWKAIPYQAKGFRGVMLGDGGGPAPVPLPIHLRKRGAYRISLGLYSGWRLPQVRVRLSSDLCCQRVRVPGRRRDGVHDVSCRIYEVPWKEADLTGQRLILESCFAEGPGGRPSALAFVRLTPIDAIRDPHSRPRTYPLFVTEDGHGIFKAFPHSRPEDLLESFENNVPEDDGLTGLIWGSGDADICNYPTRVGNAWPVGDAYEGAARNFFRNTTLWRRKGWDSLELVRQYAAKRNWEFHVYLRLQAFAAPFPFDRLIRSRFFQEHPHYHCLDRQGQRIGRLSYAYPEVQEHMLGLINEIIGYHPDGVCLCLVRGLPLVLYEPVMVEGFEKAHGVDPRQLPDADPRWMAYRAAVVTSFLRRVKSLLKRRQRLSVITPGLAHDCVRWGLDVGAWIREGIVNDVFPFGQHFDRREVHRFDVTSLDFSHFSGLEGRRNVRLIPMAAPTPNGLFRRRMRAHLKHGADGYAAWDGIAGGRPVSEIALPRAAGKAPTTGTGRARVFPVLSLGGLRMDKYHHFEVV